LLIDPPNALSITRLRLRHGQTELVGDSKGGFRVVTKSASVAVPGDRRIIEGVPLGINVNDGRIQLGVADTVFRVDARGVAQPMASVMEVDDSQVERIDPREIGQEPPPGSKPGDKVWRVRTNKEGAGVSFTITLPGRETGPPAERSFGVDQVGRNDPCPCGSGRKFKHCHGR
jgi:hypothetical protein